MIAPLEQRQEELQAYEVMSSGGDNRIVVDGLSGLNGYGCSPFPQYALPYSSCTSNNISMETYAYVEAYWHELLKRMRGGPVSAVEEFEWVRERVKACYELDPSTDIVLGSSGTDLELVVLALACARDGGAHNIVLGANEVGSGIEHAAKGRYFSGLTPLGRSVSTGAPIGALGSMDITYANVDIRDADGRVRWEHDVVADIATQVEMAVRNGRRAIAHVIHRSKTGLIVPTYESVRALQARFGDDILVVVDACQGRISIRVVNEYLRSGAAVLLTGSKFFSGPPFSGALLIPAGSGLGSETRTRGLKSLSDFFTRAEFPKGWACLDERLPGSLNQGLLLRWQAAVYEMKRVFQVPNPRIEYVINAFTRSVRRMVVDADFLHEVKISTDTAEDMTPVNTVSPFELNTIMTFQVNSSPGARPLSFKDARILHKALYSDISKALPTGGRIAAIPIQLGQPVKVERMADGRWTACLRVALSAHMIAELAPLDDTMIDWRFQADMNMLRCKLDLILVNWGTVRQALVQ